MHVGMKRKQQHSVGSFCFSFLFFFSTWEPSWTGAGGGFQGSRGLRGRERMHDGVEGLIWG